MKNFIYTSGLLIILVGLLTSFVLFIEDSKSTKQVAPPETQTASEAENNNGVKIDEEEIIEEELQPVVTSTTIAGVGDILMAISVISDVRQSDGTYDFKPLFQHVKPYIQAADIAIANQETIIGGKELGLSGYPLFNSPYEVGDALVDTGFDIVSIANNHTIDAKEKGVLNATNYYDSINLPYTGAYKSEEDRSIIRTIEKNGIIFSFLAYSYGTNGLVVPEGKDYLINLIDPEIINEEINRAKEISDVVCLNLHFGNEYELLPNETQKMLVREFANTGADIIFGHHPHVLQPMEWIENEDGRKTFVAYSLGNFISGQVGIEREIGGIVQLEVEKTTIGEDVSIELKNPQFLPTFTYKQNWRKYMIYPLHEITDPKILKDAEKHLQKTKAHVSQWLPELKFELK